MTAQHFWDETTKTEIGWPEVWALFQPVSRAGARFKRGVRPYLPEEEAAWQAAMRDWQSLAAAMEDEAWRKKLLEELRALPDVEAVLHLIAQGAALRQVDFFEMKSFLWKGRLVTELLAAKDLHLTWWAVPDWEALLRKLNAPGALGPAFSLVEVGDSVLLALREDLSRVEGQIFASKKEQIDQLRARYKRSPSKEGQYIWDKEQRDWLDQAAQDADLQWVQENPFEVIYQVIEPPQLIAWREQREQKLAEIEDREVLVLQQLVQAFRPNVERLLEAHQALARLDWTLAKAQVALQWSGCAAVWVKADACSQINGCQDGQMTSDAGDDATEAAISSWKVTGGWHPLAREAVEKRGGQFTRLDLELQQGVGLITGPNMGGKTVVLKTFGLLQALAQHALPVPADAFHFQPVERIGLSGGEEQSLVSGVSSFGGEMQRIATLLQAPGRALLLLDEVARTTNPEEGEALAIGLASYLLESEHTALFASHFPRVAQVKGIQSFRVVGLRTDLLDEWEQCGAGGDVLQKLQSAIEYRLVKCTDGEVPKHAVRLAKWFGLPDALLAKTREALSSKAFEQTEQDRMG